MVRYPWNGNSQFDKASLSLSSLGNWLWREKGLHRNTGWEFLLLPQYGHQFVKGEWTKALSGSGSGHFYTDLVFNWHTNFEYWTFAMVIWRLLPILEVLGKIHTQMEPHFEYYWICQWDLLPILFQSARQVCLGFELNVICIIFEFPQTHFAKWGKNYDTLAYGNVQEFHSIHFVFSLFSYVLFSAFPHQCNASRLWEWMM